MSDSAIVEERIEKIATLVTKKAFTAILKAYIIPTKLFVIHIFVNPANLSMYWMHF